MADFYWENYLNYTVAYQDLEAAVKWTLSNYFFHSAVKTYIPLAKRRGLIYGIGAPAETWAMLTNTSNCAIISLISNMGST